MVSASLESCETFIFFLLFSLCFCIISILAFSCPINFLLMGFNDSIPLSTLDCHAVEVALQREDKSHNIHPTNLIWLWFINLSRLARGAIIQILNCAPLI